MLRGLRVRLSKLSNMMTPSETDTGELGNNRMSESAVLEISSSATGGNVKQEDSEVDFHSNNSTSVEGSVVSNITYNILTTILRFQQVKNSYD